MRIAIASGKGGTGKTTLAVNLALKLSESHSTALLDLDVEEPNGGIFIQGKEMHKRTAKRMIPKWDQNLCSLCGKCPAFCRYNAIIRLGDYILVMPELCHSCYACSELCPDNALPMVAEPLGTLRHIRQNKLDFVESRLEIGLEQSAPLISQSIAFADESFSDYDYQILDSPPGTSCSMIAAVKTADFSILVSEPTPFGLHDLSLAVETMRHLDKPFGVVINRWGIGNDEILRYLDQEAIPLLAKIPHDRAIAAAYSAGEILYQKFPAVNEALDEIHQYIRRLA